MDYVRQSLGPGEELIHVGHFHWFYTFGAMMSIVWGFVTGILIVIASVYLRQKLGMDHSGGGQGWLHDVQTLHPGIRIAAFLSFVLGFLGFAYKMVLKTSTEIAVTTSRLIFKRGLVARYVGEMSIDRIEGVNVAQTVMGRIFGFGRIIVHGMGVGEITLPDIADPLSFRKAIEKARVT
jgi:uncharacterized membrane protein YdbT with pleckstrin-like domain